MYIEDTQRVSSPQVFGFELQFMYHHQSQEDKSKEIYFHLPKNKKKKLALNYFLMLLMLF